jgi:hypothetical protein
MTKFHSSFWLNKTPLCKYHVFLIYLSVVEHLGCFYSIAIVSNAAINIGVQVPLLSPDLHLFGYTPRSDIVGSYGSFIFVFYEASILFSIVVVLIYIPTSSA